MNNSNLYIMSLIKYYLRAYKIAFKDKELCKVLVTDPDFPSLASVSRTLNYYGLSSDAYLLEKQENVTSLKGKLVRISSNEGHFFVVRIQNADSLTLFDGKNYTLSVNDFLKVWDGVVLIVEEPNAINTFHREWLSVQTQMAFFAVLCVLLLLDRYCMLPMYPMLLLNGIGVGLSVLQMKHRLGVGFADRYCQIGKRFDCQIVSAKQPLSGRLPFALDELGMFFFLGNMLSVVMIGNVTMLHLVLLAFASLICLGLLAYQAFFIRKYCMYCLGTYLAVWLSTLVAIKTAVLPLDWGNIVYNAGIAACWALFLSYLVSQYFQRQKESFENEIQWLRLKRNHVVCKVLTNSSPMIGDIGMSGMLFGEKGASCRISMVVSLDCKFCRKAIREAASLIKNFPHRFCCEVVLTTTTSLKDEKADYVALHLRELNIVQEYNNGNRTMSILRKVKRIQKMDVLPAIVSLYRKNQEKIKAHSIDKLPFVLINGKVMSPFYSILDYQYIFEN